jgi:hypothetical protein
MSDAEAPAEAQGGPSWRRNAPATPAPPPLEAGAPGTPLRDAVVRTHDADLDEELYHPRYSRSAGTPLPYLVVSFVLLGAAWWAMRWSSPTPSAPDPVRSSEWWTNITGVLLPGEEIRFGSYSQSRMWIALALLMVAVAAVLTWIGRLGHNLRQTEQPFGAVLPLLALLAWWILPLTIGMTGDADRSRSDLLVRFLLAFGILFAQFLLLRWPLVNRIWRSGHLPYDVASIVLWLPMLIPWSMYFLSSAYSLFDVGDEGSIADSSWRPTPAMVDWARDLSRATAIGLLVLLVVVSVMQHVGMVRDRTADAAARERARAERLPLLPPGA